MRLYLLYYFCLLSLTSCVNYVGSKNNSRRLDVVALSQQHVYHIPKLKLSANHWWTRFHDPQLNHLISVALVSSPDMQIAASRVRWAQELAVLLGKNPAIFTSITLTDRETKIQKTRIDIVGLILLIIVRFTKPPFLTTKAPMVE